MDLVLNLTSYTCIWYSGEFLEVKFSTYYLWKLGGQIKNTKESLF
jgi:hypothetical protein